MSENIKLFFMKLKTLKKRYLEYLEVEKNRSQNTVKNYKRYLERFLDWTDAEDTSDLDQEIIRQYQLHLKHKKTRDGEPLSTTTRNYHLIALRGMLEYASKRDIEAIGPEKIELAQRDERDIEVLTPEELDRLLQAPTEEKETLATLRDKAILETLFSTGLRVSELVSLDREKIDYKRGEISVKGKGGKRRVVFLSDQAQKALKKYLKKRDDPDPCLFARTKKGIKPDDLRLSPRSIQRTVKKWTKKAGITKDVTPHTLRHQLGTDLLLGGADLRAVQEILGHSDISTTQIYTHLTNQKLKEVHESYHDQRRKEDEEEKEKSD